MRELAREIAYRPLIMPLAMIVWAIIGSVCGNLSFELTLLLAILPLLFYYTLLRWLKVNPRPLPFLILIILSQLLVFSVSQEIATRRTRYLVAKTLLAKIGTEPQTILGRVTTFPQGSARGWQLRLEPLAGVLVGYGEILFYLPPGHYDDSRLPRIGDIISAETVLKPLAPARHPFLRGSFRVKVFSGLVATTRIKKLDELSLVARFSGGLGAVEKLRRSLYRVLFDSAGAGEAAAILQAVLIGSRDQLRPVIKELFLDFGVFHLFAISGLHLSIVVGLFFFVLRRLLSGCMGGVLAYGSVPLAAALTLLFMPLYIVLAGLHLPVVRAGIMALFFLSALLLGRLRDPLSALLGAAIVILYLWPQALFELSFQLSFSAVTAILWVLPRAYGWWQIGVLPLCQRLPNRLQVLLRNIFYLLSSSAAISMATAPWLINQVHFLASYSLAANLLFLPLFSLVIIPLGMLSLCLAPWPGLMTLFLKPLVWLINTLLGGTFFMQELLPGRRCYFSALTTLEMVLAFFFILTVACLLTYPHLKKIGILFLCSIVFVACIDRGWWLYEEEREKLSFAAFVGGRPQALLVEIPGREALLINGGSWCGSGKSSPSGVESYFSMARNVVAPYCWRRKIKRIDTIILTEPQRGLVGGLLFLVEHFQVREIWYHGVWSGYPPFSNFCRMSQEQFGVRWRKISSSSFPFTLNGVEISIVGPPANDFIFLSSRRDSLLAMAPSLQLSYGDFSALVWGGGQIDTSSLPESVDLMALLVDPDEPLPELFKSVAIKAGGWYLTPGRRGLKWDDKVPYAWSQAHAWDVKKDGFLFLEAGLSGSLTDKLPSQLISGCQGGLE